MAIDTVQEGELQALTEWGYDKEWEGLDSLLSLGVWRRLARVDRALYASHKIAEMLIRDQRGKDDARDEDVSYKGLNACDVEALRLAVIELGSCAQEALGEVRENKYGCIGTKRANA